MEKLYTLTNEKASILFWLTIPHTRAIIFKKASILRMEEEIMAGSYYGTIFKISTWGESHGTGIGVVVDGCPAGLELTEEDIQFALNRRKPGQSKFTTQRTEGDLVTILSGVFEGKTTGTPIAMQVLNTSQRSSDYSDIASYYRPGHADYTFDEKYGFRDYRGGGRSSGRETTARVAAGAIAQKFLQQLGIKITAYSKEIGGIACTKQDFSEIENNPFRMPDAEAARKVESYMKEQMANCNSVGGIIECRVTGLPAGIGDPVFEKLDANLAKAILSIGAVKGFEMGDGFFATKLLGSENNDSFRMVDGKITKETNHSGGTLGGISDGDTLIFRAAIKPTPSIASAQNTVNKSGDNIEIRIKGRHDPIIVPRAVVVIEAMTALTLVDAILLNMTARMDRIIKFYK